MLVLIYPACGNYNRPPKSPLTAPPLSHLDQQQPSHQEQAGWSRKGSKSNSESRKRSWWGWALAKLCSIPFFRSSNCAGPLAASSSSELPAEDYYPGRVDGRVDGEGAFLAVEGSNTPHARSLFVYWDRKEGARQDWGRRIGVGYELHCLFVFGLSGGCLIHTRLLFPLFESG